MAARVPARLTRQQGRRFGLTVGGAFVALATLAWWRGSATVAPVLGTIGGALALAALLVPTHLGPVERGWMALAHAISRVTTPIVMAAMYFLVITPSGIIRRALGGNSLVHADEGVSGFWKQRPEGARRSKSMERQF